MSAGEDRAPWPQIHGFLAGLAELAGLRVSVVLGGKASEEWAIEVNPLCRIIRANRMGALLCADSHARVAAEARERKGPAFDLCHARLGQVAVPVRVGPEGEATVFACGALMHGLSEEHKDFLAQMARELGMAEPRDLLRAAAEGAGFSRARLDRFGEFIREQVEEKAAASGNLEETTELFLRKYEELMFLYAITENLTPDMEYGRVLSTILDKGLQKLSARSGFFLLTGPEGTGPIRAVAAYGDPVLREGGLAPAFTSLLASLSGPVLAEPSPEFGFAPSQPGRMLLYPFRVKGAQTGYLVIAPIPAGRFAEDEMRFVLALANQASTVLHNVHLYREISDLLFSALEAFSTAIDAKDPYTRGHSTRVAEYAVRTARVMGFGPKALTRMKIAGLLHDFGKVVVSQQILLKSSTLSLGEKDAMERHTDVGAQILGKFKAFSDIVPAIRHHHERWDGKGYPDRLSGEQIPLDGRILAVADAFDAMVTSRPYRARVKPTEALREVHAHSGDQFDPAVVAAFDQVIRDWTGAEHAVEPRKAEGHGQG